MENKSLTVRTLIVIVTYNSEDFIENCLSSLLKQDYKNWFLVVVDNNSLDQTVKKIKAFKNSKTRLSSKNFKLLGLSKNIGFSTFSLFFFGE